MNGGLPTGWHTIQLGDVLDFKNGLNKEKKFFGAGTPIVNFMDVLNHTILAPSDIHGRVTLTREEIQRFSALPDDVFFTRTSESVDEIGTSSVLVGAIPGAVFSGFVLRGRPRSNGFDSMFLAYALQNVRVRDQITSTATYTTRALTNGRSLARVEMQIPSVDEQRRIANALADADTLIVALERLIAKKQAIRQGMMQQLLTGETRLPGFSEPWRMTPLSRWGRCLRGVSYDPRVDLAAADKSFTMRLLRSNNVQDNSLELQELQFVHERRVDSQQILQADDVVICMANGSKALVGKSALFEGSEDRVRYTIGAFMGVFRTNSEIADARYATQLLKVKSFRDWLDVILAGSSINNIRPSDVEAFEFAAPLIEEQRAIAGALRDSDDEIRAQRRCLAKAKAVKWGMMQELLTGRTRLPPEKDAA